MKFLCGLGVVLLAITALYAGTTVVLIRGTGTTSSGCTTAGSDAFTSDPQAGSNWTTDLEEDGTGLTWDSTNNNESNSAAGITVINSMVYTATAASSSDMWVKAKIVTIAAAGNFGIVLRRSSAGGNQYVVRLLTSGAAWGYWTGTGTQGFQTINTATGCSTFSNGDVLAAYVTGTGTNTEMKVWKNPSGSTPTDWGTACATITDDPAVAVDSGTYGGIFGNTANATRRTMVVDDFSVGGCT